MTWRRLARIGVRLTTTRSLKGDTRMSFSRRTLLKASAASAVVSGVSAPFVTRAQTAEFTYKFANNLPESHPFRSEEHTSELQSQSNLVCRLLLEKKN